MTSEIKSAIMYKLIELFPDDARKINRFTDDIPQNFTPPAFVVYELDHKYSKRLNNKYNSKINFDIAFFSDKDATDIKSDCYTVQEVLFRGFDLFGSYKALNKNAKITDNVLHLTFDVNYSEMKIEASTNMQTQETNTNI